MPHRVPAAWELCERSPLTGVHTWSFVTTVRADQENPSLRETVVTAVSCLHCERRPPVEVENRLAREFETQKKRDKLAAGLREMHKDATGLGKRRTG